MIEIQYKSLKGFDSIQFPSLLTEDSEYFPLSTLSVILGYSSPYSLIQSIPDVEKIKVDELYAMSTVNDYSPISLTVFKKELSQFKPLQFTTLKGLENILSRNTFTLPRIKEAIAECVGIKPIHTPRPESSFYDSLCSIFKCSRLKDIEIHRQVYLAGYRVDIELVVPEYNKSFVIEYDENNHKGYDQIKEKEREMAIRQLGYDIIRIDDKLNPVESASCVYHKIMNILSAKRV